VAVAALAGCLLNAGDIVVPIVAGGIVGVFVDSLAGATLEGWTLWIDNDLVNGPGTAAGAAVAMLLR